MLVELEGTRIGVMIDDQWCGALLYGDDIVFLVDRSGASRHVGCGAGYGMKWMMELNGKNGNGCWGGWKGLGVEY